MEVWKVNEAKSMLQWLVWAASTLNQSNFDRGMVLSWSIWGSRNDEVKNNVKNSPTRTSTFALQYVEEFIKAQQFAKICGVPMERRWHKPKHGYVKVNFDGAIWGSRRLLWRMMQLDRLVAKFQAVEFTHVKRDANHVTDSLAKFALTSKTNSYWVEEYPSIVEQLVVSDCNDL
ncbi:hypothetical protein REPUB_Repub08aG0237300 [Reevesia pubescens]